MSASPTHAASEIDLASLAGVSTTTLRIHKSQGCPMPEKGGDLEAWRAAYASWRIENGKKPSSERADPDAKKWAAERVKWAAIQKRLEVGKLAGKLVEREHVERRTVLQITAVKSSLNAMVRKVSPRLFNAPSVDEIERQLQEEIDYILATFARGLSELIDERPEPSAAGPGSSGQVRDAGLD